MPLWLVAQPPPLTEALRQADTDKGSPAGVQGPGCLRSDYPSGDPKILMSKLEIARLAHSHPILPPLHYQTFNAFYNFRIAISSNPEIVWFQASCLFRQNSKLEIGGRREEHGGKNEQHPAVPCSAIEILDIT